MNLFKKKENYTKHENIFKIISKKTDTICLNINKRDNIKNKFANISLKYFYDKNSQGNIEKYFIDTDLFKWEIDVYLYLVDKNIVPLSSTDNQKIIYHTNKLQSLFTVLKNTCKNKTNIKCILNELFSFVNKFKKIHFVHGNLNLYNIFIDENGMFSVIDFSNSSFKNKKIGGGDEKCDLYLLYIELYNFYNGNYSNDGNYGNDKIIIYLKELFSQFSQFSRIRRNYNL
jgi:RIO-like serine/threonine protein kinase